MNNWTWKKPICISKGRVRFDFSKHRGRSLEKHTPGKFSIGEDIMNSVSRTREKNDLARSTDSNEMHPRPLIKVSTISGSLYFKPFSSVASIYCSLDSRRKCRGLLFKIEPRPLPSRIPWCTISDEEAFFRSGRTASIPRDIRPTQMICVLIYFSIRIASVPNPILERDTYRSFLFVFFSARALQVN